MRFLLLMAFVVTICTEELKADQYPPGYIVVYDQLSNGQWSDNLYLHIFGSTTRFTPHRMGAMTQKQSFVVTKSGYIQYTISGTTTYNDGSTVCVLGSGSIWVSAGSYQRCQIIDFGWDLISNCHKAGLSFF